MMEVLQNLILDFVEAKDNWKEQWVVCEAMAFWLSDHSSDPLYQYVSIPPILFLILS